MVQRPVARRRGNRVKHWLKRLSLLQTVLLLAASSIIFGGVWILVVAVMTEITGHGSDQKSWLETLTSVATFAFAVGAGGIVLFEYDEVVNSRNLDLYRDIYEKSMDSKQINARRYIYQSFPGEQEAIIEFVRTDRRAQMHYKEVLSLLDYFGFLVEQDWVTADEIVDWVSPFVVKVWAKIGPVVEYERQQRPEEPDHYFAARILAEKCQEWREKYYGVVQEDIRFDKNRV